MRNLIKRTCLLVLCICMILSFTPTISYAADSDTKTPETKSMSNDQGEAAESMAVKKYAHTVGTDIYIGDEKYIMKGVVASNAVAASPATYDVDMMTEKDYEEIADLGFNTVRFLSHQPPVQLVVCYQPSKGLYYCSPKKAGIASTITGPL